MFLPPRRFAVVAMLLLCKFFKGNNLHKRIVCQGNGHKTFKTPTNCMCQRSDVKSEATWTKNLYQNIHHASGCGLSLWLKERKERCFPNLSNNLYIISMLRISLFICTCSQYLLCVYAPPGGIHNPSLNLFPLTSCCWACQHQDPKCQRLHFIRFFFFFNYIRK